jgi:pimeloyl-ACP methyl ester carboxylesterase
MIEENHLTKRYGKTRAVDQPVPLAQRPRVFTWARIAALLMIIVLLTGLTYLRVSSSPETVSVPQGAHAGQLTMHACTYATEQGAMPADCGTLVVPENRASSKSRLIALPVTRILARSSHPLAPIFHLNGGPGITNMTFPQASRLTAQHDVVMVGYRGVDGSSVLNCPEVTAALENSADYLGKASLSAYSQAFASCAKRLERSGVDLAGYTLAEQADDIEAARVALGYKRIDLLSESAGTRLAMIYQWRYPNSVDRSVMIGVNPPGNFIYSGAEIDQGIERYSALCAQQPACRARTGNLAASMKHTAARHAEQLVIPADQAGQRPGRDVPRAHGGELEQRFDTVRADDPRLVDLRRAWRSERPVAALVAVRCHPPPVVHLGRVCKHRDGRRAARRALLQLRRGPGLDHRQSPRGVLVGGRRHGSRLAGQPG